MRLTVRVTPRGGRDAVDGWGFDPAGRAFLKVRVRAAASDGRANAAVTALLAERLGRPLKSIRIVSGAAARLKSLEIEDLDGAALEAVFGAPG